MDAVSAIERDPQIVRRRRILFAGGGLILLILIAVALVPLLAKDTPPKRSAPPKQAVILARIAMKPVGAQTGKGLAEVIRRGQQQSIRVLAARLPQSKRGEVYGLFLAGGREPQRLIGSAVVGAQRIFIGEAKVGIGELEQHRRIELRRATTGKIPKETIVLRGKIPR